MPPARVLRRVLVTRASMKLTTRWRSSLPSSAMVARWSPRASSGGAEPSSGGVVDEQVVAGDVEDLGEADDGVGGRGDAPVLVAADLGGVGADALGQLALGPAVLFAQLLDPFLQAHQGPMLVPAPLCDRHGVLACLVGPTFLVWRAILA
jgi:hypothetical protein